MDGALDILLSLLQINVALGILYIGLEAARYRNKLHHGFVERLTAHTLLNESGHTQLYLDLVRDEHRFSENHHYVSMWVGEVPSNRLSELDETLVSQFTGGRQKRTLPWIYRWFRSDSDRWLTFVVASLIPILLTWDLAIRPKRVDYITCYYLIMIGQLCVSAHVLAGWLMTRQFGRAFGDALENLIETLEAVRSEKQLDDFTPPEK